MALQVIKWTVKRDRGLIDFGRTIPLAGNTYEIEVVGEPAESLKFFVLDCHGEVAVAHSELIEGKLIIAFNTEKLRSAFSQDFHEIVTFHTIVSNGENTLAESDLPVIWNPAWTDPASSEVFTMQGPPGEQGKQGVGISKISFVKNTPDGYLYRVELTNDSSYDFIAPFGPKGDKGDRGYTFKSVRNDGLDQYGNGVYALILENGEALNIVVPHGPPGLPSHEGYVFDEETELWHRVVATKNEAGEVVLKVEEEGFEKLPNSQDYVTTDFAQTITGGKTFKAPTRFDGIVDADGGIVSMSAFLNTVSAAKNAMTAAAIVFNAYSEIETTYNKTLNKFQKL